MKAGRVGIGVVGVGLMGRRHAENLRWHVPEAELVAVADADRALARRVADELGVLACASVDELLSRDDVRAVIISSPSRFHAEQAVAAVRAGKDVLLEKPLATSLADADRVLAAAESAGARLQVGFQRRYDPAYAEAKRLVASGTLGRPVLFKGIDRDLDVPDLPASAGLAHLLVESAIHDFDLARWVMDAEVARVSATAARVCHGGTDDHPPNLALVDLVFADGRLGEVECYRGARYGYDIRAEIVCEEGTAFVGHEQRTRLRVLTREGARHDVVTGWLERFGEAYVLEARDFVRRALERRPPAVTGRDGREALAIALAACDAAETGGAAELR